MLTDRGTTEIEYGAGMRLRFELEGCLIKEREGSTGTGIAKLTGIEEIIGKTLIQYLTKATSGIEANGQEPETKEEVVES